jgi:AraC-like DNA-binding protein
MSESRRSYLQARAVQEATVRLEPAVFYHGRFRGFAAEPHAHTDHAQFLLPLGGRMHLVAGGEDHLLGPEWGALIMAGVPHAFTHIDGELDFVAIDAPVAMLVSLADGLGMPLRADAPVLVAREVRLWLQGQQLAAEVDAPQTGHARVLEAGFVQLGTYFLRALHAAPAAQTAKEPRVLRAVERMLRDFGDELTIEALAAEQAMSPRHFERCFKEALGRSPKQFLIEVRIGAAQDMLARTERPIAAIALDVGFSQPSHFGEAFKRLTGQTPREYRQTKAPD